MSHPSVKKTWTQMTIETLKKLTKNSKEKVKIFCADCPENIIWLGSLNEWVNQLANPEAPLWYSYAQNHARTHKHKIQIKYPSGNIYPL